MLLMVMNDDTVYRIHDPRGRPDSNLYDILTAYGCTSGYASFLIANCIYAYSELPPHPVTKVITYKCYLDKRHRLDGGNVITNEEPHSWTFWSLSAIDLPHQATI